METLREELLKIDFGTPLTEEKIVKCLFTIADSDQDLRMRIVTANALIDSHKQTLDKLSDAMSGCVNNVGYFRGEVRELRMDIVRLREYINENVRKPRLDQSKPSTEAPAATSKQVGGDHYKGFAIQPIEFIHANNIPFAEANVIKYVMRHRDKNGREDLLKAKHYIDLILEMEYREK